MRLLIDANIILDVMVKRAAYYLDSAAVWKLCETEQAKGYVSVLTIANIVYILRKELEPQTVEETLKKLALIFEFEDLNASDIARAAEKKWNDFEDAIQCVTAERLHVDYIITRNIRNFKESCVPMLTPGEFLARL